MVRRLHAPFAFIGAALFLLTLVGCEGWRQAIRPSSDETTDGRTVGKHGDEVMAAETDPTRILDVNADAKNPKTFFRNNRKAGGLSSEAREVESHLGIGNGR